MVRITVTSPSFRAKIVLSCLCHVNLALNLSGSFCALATPFRAIDEALDLEAFTRLIEFQIVSGTRGLVVAGSTGEAAALSEDEFVILIETAVRCTNGRVPVIAGSGMQSTRKTVAQTRLAASAGAEAALVVTPAYVRPTQEGLYRHFSEVAESAGLPVVLYNVPSRTACDMLPEIVARLQSNVGIIGIKEAHADESRMRELLSIRQDSFAILSGDDPSCARAILAGADGVISVAANVAPAAMQALCESAASGDVEATARHESILRELFELLAVEPNPIPLKWCLHKLGFGADRLRLPLLPMSASYHAQGERVLNESGSLESARQTL